MRTVHKSTKRVRKSRIIDANIRYEDPLVHEAIIESRMAKFAYQREMGPDKVGIAVGRVLLDQVRITTNALDEQERKRQRNWGSVEDLTDAQPSDPFLLLLKK